MCVYYDSLLYYLAQLYPDGAKYTGKIYRCDYAALAAALCERAQENQGKSDSEQLKNNIKIMTEYIEVFGVGAVGSFISGIIAASRGASEGAKNNKGDLLKTLTGTARGATQGMIMEIPSIVGNFGKKVLDPTQQ